MDMLEIIWLISLFITGAWIGSFVTVVVPRIPEGKNWFGERPSCALCKHELYCMDYLPIISILITKCRCRYCKQQYRFPILYFTIELCSAILFTVNYIILGLNDQYIFITLCSITFVVMIAIISAYKHLPKTIISFFMWCGMLYNIYINGSLYDLICITASIFLFGILCRGLLLRHHLDILDYKLGETRFQGRYFNSVLLLSAAGIWLGDLYCILSFLGIICIYLPISYIFKKEIPEDLVMTTILCSFFVTLYCYLIYAM